ANLFLIPGAVAGAVLMWDGHYRGTHDVATP
ncbi:MAG TPA: sulfate transporter CysZ, partial [Halomonas sp.]|nr:sulfate transporter CysZ [Halomonas sp.]